MSRLDLACEHLPGATVIAVGGEIDSTNAVRLESFVAASRRGPGEQLVFDLSGVSFMDSTGLRTLLNAHLYAEDHGGGVRLAALQSMPARLVAITRVGDHLPVHATVEDALTAVLTPPEPPYRPVGGNGTGTGVA
ncbi:MULTISPECIES: STAS domain-containing protein [unclassified Nonomuraea]|uniref:STAS domain-containing protein n=1 Tax=unclassified Nonomuraea TaxID=2593643 RepID=UPI0033EDE8AA